MRKLMPLIPAVFFCGALLAYNSFSDSWREVRGDHFIVYYTQDDKFAKDALDRSEVCYRRIALELGYPRYSDFWTWDKRVKLYIYPDHQSYLKSTNQPSWSHGMADYYAKEITSFAWSNNFLESLLPHEIAHLIFRDFVGFKGEVPLWLDEGVAQWSEEIRRDYVRKMIRKMYEDDGLLSLENMMRIDLKEIRDMGKVYVLSTYTKDGQKAPLILGAENLVNIYYLQAVSLVGFLVEKYGSESFAAFCRQLRDGKSLGEALRFTYPTHLENLGDLEVNWRKYIAGN